jgi:hypothetical protein
MNECAGSPVYPSPRPLYYLRPSPSWLPECPIDGAQISIGRPRGTASVTAAVSFPAGFLTPAVRVPGTPCHGLA